ncbi:transposable element Tcb1 transposase [Trichonephila clavipes]|nr:transposable element Tcb1 transposase [Trichonephila clavipes]
MLMGEELYNYAVDMLAEKNMIHDEELIHANEVREEVFFESVEADSSTDEFFKKRSVMSRRKQRSAYDQVSEFDTRRIVIYRDCGLSFREIVSPRTIRPSLQQSGLPAIHPLLGLPLTQNHRRFHRQWCDGIRMWVAEWNAVVFTDESHICLQHHDGRIRVRRHRGERRLNSCVIHRHTGSAPENMWLMVARRLTQITPPAATPDQLWQRVEAAWSAVPQ